MAIPMHGVKEVLKTYRRRVPALAIVLTGALFALTFARGTFWLPLLGDHCMKTSKSVEVAYNIVRYGDPFHKYVDFQATPDNPLGNRGTILTYESPLSAWLLAGVYTIFDGADFDRRIVIARYFTFAHLLAAYLLITLLVLRKDLLALSVFTFTLIGSTFTVSYATKPLPETYAIFYEALFIALGTHLLGRQTGAIKKSIWVGGLSALLCAGGKMNYFLIALPVFIGFPFFDSSLPGFKNKLGYFSIFIAGVVLAVLGMQLFTDFGFYNAFVFMIKGNKEIINNSLWATFVEGFDAFDDIKARTLDDFGRTLFDWGSYAVLYLLAKLVFLAAFKRRTLSEWDRFSVMTALLVIGHILNYAGLRNLYIPHRYYVVPLYIIFCLALTILIADVRRLFLAEYPLKTKALKLMQRVFLERLDRRIDAQARQALRGAFIAVLVFGFTAIFAGYMSDALSSHGWRHTILLAAKSFGSHGLVIQIRDAVTALLGDLETTAIITAVIAGVLLLSMIGVRFHRGYRRLLAAFFRRCQAAGVGIVNLSIVFALSFPATFMALKNGKMFYEYAYSHSELIEHADALRAIRNDTESGALVLAWKVCMAFYADKRSITDATPKDLAYYRANDIPAVMGPVRPLDRYYRRIEKYPPPMSYWVPKTNRSNANRSDTRK